jgi:hypothetical protein
MSDGKSGTSEEFQAAQALEGQLERAINLNHVGDLDGNEVGEGTYVIYMYGPNADALFTAIEPTLRTSPLAEGATVIKRKGPPGTVEDRSVLKSVSR